MNPLDYSVAEEFVVEPAKVEALREAPLGPCPKLPALELTAHLRERVISSSKSITFPHPPVERPSP